MSSDLRNNVNETLRQVFNSLDGEIDDKWGPDDIKEWDSLGQLAILTTLDKKFKNKASKLTKLATAESVKEIYSILKKAKLVE